MGQATQRSAKPHIFINGLEDFKMTLPRLAVLEKSLFDKNKKLIEKIDMHFKTVAQSNGQPLNDKRNGRATLNKWERQNDAIRATMKEIEKTKAAIDKERIKIAAVENQALPDCIKSLINDGTLNQWRKYPNRFFVVGIDSARIIYDEKGNKITCSHLSQLKPYEHAMFRDVFIALKKAL
jgi:hypothetical protein